MAFPYTIHLLGIICLVKQSNTDYLVAIPDGRSYDDPCSSTKLNDHLPYLIIPLGQVVTSQFPGRIINNCFIIDLEKAPSIVFPTIGTSGTIDVSDAFTNGYAWSTIDASYKLNTANPKNTLLQIPFKQGRFYARRLKGDESQRDLAVITETQIEHSVPGNFDVIIDNKKLTVKGGCEFALANVAPDWLLDVTFDDKTDFNFYYRMAETTPGPNDCKAPTVKKPLFTASNHPYLTEDRGLQIACSSTNYP